MTSTQAGVDVSFLLSSAAFIFPLVKVDLIILCTSWMSKTKFAHRFREQDKHFSYNLDL